MPETQSRNALIAALDPSDQQLLLRNASLVDLRQGEAFLHPGEPVEYVFFPERGLESLVATTAEGAMVCQPRGSLGGSWPPPFHGTSVEALRPAWAS